MIEGLWGTSDFVGGPFAREPPVVRDGGGREGSYPPATAQLLPKTTGVRSGAHERSGGWVARLRTSWGDKGQGAPWQLRPPLADRVGPCRLGRLCAYCVPTAPHSANLSEPGRKPGKDFPQLRRTLRNSAKLTRSSCGGLLTRWSRVRAPGGPPWISQDCVAFPIWTVSPMRLEGVDYLRLSRTAGVSMRPVT